MKKHFSREFELQVACVNWFKLSFKPSQAILFAVPNGGSRNLLEASNLKKAGVMPGVSDLILVCRAGVLFIELKADTKISRQSQSQKEFEHIVKDLGFSYVICYNIGEFMRICTEFISG